MQLPGNLQLVGHLARHRAEAFVGEHGPMRERGDFGAGIGAAADTDPGEFARKLQADA